MEVFYNSTDNQSYVIQKETYIEYEINKTKTGWKE